jgi:hypothetical protein
MAWVLARKHAGLASMFVEILKLQFWIHSVYLQKWLAAHLIQIRCAQHRIWIEVWETK